MSKALATKNVAAALVAAALVVGFSLAYATTAKAQTVTTTTTSSASYTFTLNEKLGSKGAEVLQIQKFLNNNGFTVSSTGAGSAGNETTTFGPATKRAVIAFQTAKGISPVSGYWGPLTRAAANAVGGTTTGTTGGTTTGGTTTPTGPGISVTAATQPANALAVTGASRVPFTTFTIKNNSSAAVTVNSVAITRTGPANDAVFNGGGVILVDDQGNQLGVQRTLNSDHTVSAGDPFTLQAGQTKTITVAANMCNTWPAGVSCLNNYAGQVVGLTVTGINTTVPVSGTLPITGAMQTVNASLVIGQIQTQQSAFDPISSQTKNIGDTGIKFSGLKFTAGSQEDVKLYSVRFRLNGSVSSSDLANIVAVVNGTTYPTTVSTDGRYYTASFVGGVLIQKGMSTDVYLQGDITGSNASGRVVEFDIDRASDVYVVGQSYGYGIQPLDGSNGLATPASDGTHGSAYYTGTQPWFEGATVKIQGASVTTIGRANAVAAQNIAVNVPNVALGGFETNLKGEAVSVQSLPVTVSTSNSTLDEPLTNVSIVDENGSVVAGPVDENVTTHKITFTNTITFPVGDHVYTIKGKVPATAANNDTVFLASDPYYWTGVTGQTTGNNVQLVTVSSSFNMNTMTVRAATLAASVSPTPAQQTVTSGSQNLVLANIQLDASQSGEDIRVANLPLTITATSSALLADLSTCRIYDGTTSLTSGSNVKNPTAASTNFTFDNTITIAKGTVKTLSVQCNVSSNTPNTTTFNVGLTGASGVISGFNATGVTSSNTVAVSGSTQLGQTMTVGTASLAVSLDSSSPSTKLAAGGTTGVELADYKFRASNDNITLQQIGLILTNGSGTQSDLSNVSIWQGSTKVGSVLFTVSTALVNLSTPVTLTRDTDVVLTVKGDLAGVGPSQAGTSGHVIKVDIDPTLTNTYGVSSSGTKVTAASATSAAAGVTLYRSFPTVAQDSLSSTGAADGNLVRFKVTANSSGSLGIDQVAFNVSYANATVANAKLYAFTDASYSTPVSGQASDGQVGSTQAAVVSGTTYKIVVPTNAVSVSAGQTVYFALRGDVVPTTGASVVAKILGDATAVASNTDTVLEAGASNFIWTPNTNGTTAVNASVSDFVNGAGVIGLPSAGFTQARGL